VFVCVCECGCWREITEKEKCEGTRIEKRKTETLVTLVLKFFLCSNVALINLLNLFADFIKARKKA